MKSEQINELAAALAKAQSEMHGARKDTQNPFFKKNYADLQAIWEACREALTKNGLSVAQVVDTIASMQVLVTFLLHSSGQWISSAYPLRPVKDDPQGMGSAISYARRYSLAAMVGVYQTDDDAETAQNRNKSDPAADYFESLHPYSEELPPPKPKLNNSPITKDPEKSDTNSKDHFGPHLYNQKGICTVMTKNNTPCGEHKGGQASK